MDHDPDISEEIFQIYQHHTSKKTKPLHDHLKTILTSELEKYSAVFVVLDALDEYSENTGTREALVKDLQSLTPTTRLLITSRSILSIERVLRNESCLEIRAQNQDMGAYIRNRIRNSPRRHLKAMEDDIVDAVTDKAKGG